MTNILLFVCWSVGKILLLWTIETFYIIKSNNTFHGCVVNIRSCFSSLLNSLPTRTCQESTKLQ